MDVTGQTGGSTPAHHNGHQPEGKGEPPQANGWEGWSGAGSALEPESDSVVPAWRRGMDALRNSRTAQTPPRYAEMLADAGVRAPVEEEAIPPGESASLPDYGILPAPDYSVLPDDEILPYDHPLLDAPPVTHGTPFAYGAERPLTEPTPPQGTPNPFARLLDVPSVPSAPPAPRPSTYPVYPQPSPEPAAPVSGGPGRTRTPAGFEPIEQGPVPEFRPLEAYAGPTAPDGPPHRSERPSGALRSGTGSYGTLGTPPQPNGFVPAGPPAEPSSGGPVYAGQNGRGPGYPGSGALPAAEALPPAPTAPPTSPAPVRPARDGDADGRPRVATHGGPVLPAVVPNGNAAAPGSPVHADPGGPVFGAAVAGRPLAGGPAAGGQYGGAHGPADAGPHSDRQAEPAGPAHPDATHDDAGLRGAARQGDGLPNAGPPSGPQNTRVQNTGYQNTGAPSAGYQNTGHRNVGHQYPGPQAAGQEGLSPQNTARPGAGQHGPGHQDTGHQGAGHQGAGQQDAADPLRGVVRPGPASPPEVAPVHSPAGLGEPEFRQPAANHLGDPNHPRLTQGPGTRHEADSRGGADNRGGADPLGDASDHGAGGRGGANGQPVARLHGATDPRPGDDTHGVADNRGAAMAGPGAPVPEPHRPESHRPESHRPGTPAPGMAAAQGEPSPLGDVPGRRPADGPERESLHNGIDGFAAGASAQAGPPAAGRQGPAQPNPAGRPAEEDDPGHIDPSRAGHSSGVMTHGGTHPDGHPVGESPWAEQAGWAEQQPHGHGLPQRVPAEPDVPRLSEPTVEPPAPAPALSRIASGLRRDDVPATDRPDFFDIAAVLSAVRDVPGVRDAQLKASPTGGHNLRLDLADGADPAYVSRVVARMLNERMGLVAEPPAALDPNRVAEQIRAEEQRQAESRPAEPGPDARPASPAGQTVPTQPGGYRPEGPFPPSRQAPVTPAQRGAPPLPPGLVPASSAPREPRRRHPVSVRGRYPSELRGGTSTERMRPDEPPEPNRPPALTPAEPGRRVVLDHVQVSTFGMDATVEVRLVAGEKVALGVSNGPAVDGYVLRLCAAAAANAVDELLSELPEESQGRGHCYVEQAAIVPMGSCEVAVVVVLMVCNGWVEQLAGSALVSGDPRQAVVRATLAAVNRRLTALLP
ncbi:hypothetical protein [Hamadaea tsunoensis]|uniref:hypothetical protein n=1 Tax=Hamadaea tsunoensis TaxID=53368 RepID=UPI0012F9E1A9|nr:hypothetical protein [Hamadaea tsunoensis]